MVQPNVVVRPGRDLPVVAGVQADNRGAFISLPVVPRLEQDREEDHAQARQRLIQLWAGYSRHVELIKRIQGQCETWFRHVSNQNEFYSYIESYINHVLITYALDSSDHLTFCNILTHIDAERSRMLAHVPHVTRLVKQLKAHLIAIHEWQKRVCKQLNIIKDGNVRCPV